MFRVVKNEISMLLSINSSVDSKADKLLHIRDVQNRFFISVRLKKL